MSCQQVPTTPAFNPYPRSVQVGEFEVAITGGIWVAIRAAKVLLKFKLLEVQQISIFDLKRWASSTPYFQLVHARHFLETPQAEWIEQLMDDLVRVNAAARADQHLINI
jgi:hypothetical protein